MLTECQNSGSPVVLDWLSCVILTKWQNSGSQVALDWLLVEWFSLGSLSGTVP